MRKLILAAALVFAVGGTVRADILADLIANNGTITVGDKVFSNFGYSKTGDMPDASAINVVPIVISGAELGIRFQGDFRDNPGGGSSDGLLTYRVTVTDPARQIIDVHLHSDSTAVGGSASISISE